MIARLTTRYSFRAPTGAVIAFRTLDDPGAMQRFLSDNGFRHWAYLTAVEDPPTGPAAERNRENLESLRQVLSSYVVYDAEARAPTGETEPGLFVLGISEADAVAAARRFRQNAIVVPDSYGRPSIKWIQQAALPGWMAEELEGQGVVVEE